MLHTILPYSWYVLNTMYIPPHVDDNPFYSSIAANIPAHKYISKRSKVTSGHIRLLAG
jgi:hypothetical protein